MENKKYNFSSQYHLDTEDPWGMDRASQKIRNREYAKGLNEFFKDKKFDNALDLACGDGVLTEKLSFLFDKITLCDAYSEMINIAKKRNFNVENTFQNKLPNIPDSNKKYDLIFAIEVLYYLNQDSFEIFIDDLYNFIDENSFFIATLNKKEFLTIKTKFKIVYKITRYKPIYSLGDKLFYFKKNLLKAKAIILGENIFFDDIKTQKQEIIRKYRKYLRVLIYFLPFVIYLLEMIYKSIMIEKLLMFIGKFNRYEHERSLYILKKAGQNGKNTIN